MQLNSLSQLEHGQMVTIHQFRVRVILLIKKKLNCLGDTRIIKAARFISGSSSGHYTHWYQLLHKMSSEDSFTLRVFALLGQPVGDISKGCWVFFCAVTAALCNRQICREIFWKLKYESRCDHHYLISTCIKNWFAKLLIKFSTF